MSEEALKCYLVRLPEADFLTRFHGFEERLLQSNVSETLTEVTRSGDAVLRLIESSSVSYDGLIYRFALRKGMRFHDGAELQSDDVLACFTGVLKDKRSLSQLHHVVAKDPSGVAGFAIKRISRHRFEIRLQCRTADFLARLSLPELAIRQRSSGSSCGAWKIQEQSAESITLTPFADHFEHRSAHYGSVEIAVIPPEYNHHLTQDSYLFLYPGMMYKSPGKENMTDIFCRPLHNCLSYYIEFVSSPRHLSTLKTVLARAALSAFQKDHAYLRYAVNGFFPEHHLLHTSKDIRQKLELDQPLKMSLALPPEIPEAACSGLVKELRQLNVELTIVEDSEGADAVVKSLYSGHLYDIYTPLSQIVREKKQLKYLFDPDSVHFLPQSCGQTMSQFAKSDRIVPLFLTPYVARSNRVLVPEPGNLVDFHSVQASADIQRRVDYREKGLRAIGSAMQMFAHDIKKPFSMMQAILNLAETSADGDRLGEVLMKHYPQIKRSIRSANQLLQDVIEIGSEGQPFWESTSVKELIQQSLQDCCSGEAGLELEFFYDLKHTSLVKVDSDKIVRVLNNLVSNAIQAMGGRGRISQALKSGPVGATDQFSRTTESPGTSGGCLG